jgi:hypothetical protein
MDKPYAVLWDFAYGSTKNLTWCRSNSSLGPVAVPVSVEGNLDPPYALVSTRRGAEIILSAVPTDDDQYFIPMVCMFKEAFLEECRSQRTIGLQFLTHLNAQGTSEQEVTIRERDEVEDAIYDGLGF